VGKEPAQKHDCLLSIVILDKIYFACELEASVDIGQQIFTPAA